MSEILLTGIGLLSLMLAWKFVWLPTVLDGTRDTLFDLRDRRLRDYFISHSISFDHPIYASLRNLLNGHLRHTESVSIFEYVHMKTLLDGDQKLFEARIAKINSKFVTQDADLQALVDEIRYESSVAMLTYMIETSVISMLMAPLVIITTFIRQVPPKSFFATKPAVKARTFMEQCALTT